MTDPHPPRTLLVLGGGQLGRMLAAAAARLDIRITVLDPTPGCPASLTAGRHLEGSFRDREAILRAAEEVAPDAITVEIESVDTGALAALRDRGIPVHPDPAVLDTIQDKLVQREHLHAAGLPVPRFTALPDEPAAALEGARSFGLPAVQKARVGGYDGRGVAMVDAEATELPLTGSTMLEARVDLATELSVLVARSPSGQRVSYAPFEMQMDPELHLVQAVVHPAAIPEPVAVEARRVAEQAVEALGGAGLFAVEMFVDRDGRVAVNEIAPRPHNSGHLTIEAAQTSQYEQHLRAVFDLPLGSTAMHGAAAMRNLLGTDPEGPTRYVGVREALAIEGVHLHLYGKPTCRRGRKMGHVTATAPDRATALDRARRAAGVLRIVSAPASAGEQQ